MRKMCISEMTMFLSTWLSDQCPSSCASTARISGVSQPFCRSSSFFAASSSLSSAPFWGAIQ